MDETSHKLIGIAMKIHRELGAGFLEIIYKNALKIEFDANKLDADYEKILKVFYNNQIIGEFRADIIVENYIIEVKAVSQLAQSHSAQLLNYLKAGKYKNGLLLNFGHTKLEFQHIYNNPKIP